MLIHRFVGCVLLVLVLGGCQSGRQALEITRPSPGDRIAVLFEFDEHSHTTWVGDAYLSESVRTAKARGWDLDGKVAAPVVARLRDDRNGYQVRQIASTQLAQRRQQQGHTPQGFASLPRVFTNQGLFAFSKGSLEAHLQDALGDDYAALLAEGADYLVVVRQLPVVANAQSRDGSDRRIMNSYGYFLKCDRSYRACEAPRALLRAQVELIDLRSQRYVGLHPLSINFTVPAGSASDGEDELATALIDAQLRSMSAQIDRFLRSTRLLSARQAQSAADS